MIFDGMVRNVNNKDELASLLRDDSQGEAFLTVYGLEVGHDRENIIKTSALPHDSTPRVTSLDADEGNLEISSLKARIKLLEDKDKGSAELFGDDAPIKGRNAAKILTNGVADVSVPPVAEVSTVGVPTVSAIFTTASVVTPYSRRPREISAKDEGNKKVVKSDTPKKKKLQDHIDIARDAEIARIHAEEELKMMIDGLDRINEVIARHLQEYEESEVELSIGEKIDLINELVKYQDHHAKILKYQSQQSKPLSKKEQRDMSKALPTAADEPASLLRDDNQGEDFPTITSLDVGQDREIIIKTSSLPHDSTPRVTSLDADEGNLKISNLKERVKIPEDKGRGSVELSGDEAPIKGRSMEIGEKVRVERSTERGSNDTEEMVNVLTSMDAVNILTSGVVDVSTPPVAEVSTVGVPTVSGLVSTVSAIFKTTSMVTPYSRRPREISAKDKGKEKVIARDAEIARIHAEEELKMMIDGLDRNNEVIARHLQEYEESKAELCIGEKIDLINELIKYQDHHAKILKYQAQQSKPFSKKEQREFYMSVLRSYAGWKTKHFRGMTLEEIREKFIPVWKQFEDFVYMASKEEGERVKRKGLKLEQGSAKKMKTYEEVSEEDLIEMMQLVPVEEAGRAHSSLPILCRMLKQFDREDLQQLWALVKETLSIRQASSDKEIELCVELKRLFELDFEDQLWTHTQNRMHDPLEWRLYDTCGVHHVFIKDQEIFMLVERDYPLRRGLAIVMISNKLQVENYSQMANDLILKIHNTWKMVSTADVSELPLLKEFALLVKIKINLGQRHINISQRRVLAILGMYPMIDHVI
nr:hypothetical protein [Tanacetum cinerariifolium]